MTNMISMAALLAALASAGCHGKEYYREGKNAEALFRLQYLSQLARDYFVAHGTYPVGSTPLTPSTSCCTKPNHLCGVTPESDDWSDKTWQALEFSIPDYYSFQYSYESDGKTFTAKAINDTLCDGHISEFVVRGNGGTALPTQDDVKQLR